MDEQIKEIQKLLDAADGNLTSARSLLREVTGTGVGALDVDKRLENLNLSSVTDEGKVIEGIFDGEAMVAPDGQTYPVPPNYASKSKLVEGDTLKLTITSDGSFVFKQISPVERRNAVGTLATADGGYSISAEGKAYKVLTASVTFYKAEPGDQVTIVLPKDHDAVWAVLENVINKAAAEVVTDSEADPEIVIPEPLMPATELAVSADEPTAEVAEEKPEMVLPVPEEPKTSVIPSTDEEPLNNIPDVHLEQNQGKSALALGASLVSAPPVPSNEPQIEFPSGSTPLSDDQLLQNLKENLKSLEQPRYTPPETATTPLVAKPVDNIVASDLDKMGSQSQSDKQIAELDI